MDELLLAVKAAACEREAAERRMLQWLRSGLSSQQVDDNDDNEDEDVTSSGGGAGGGAGVEESSEALEQGSEQWHKRRANMLTASRFAAAVGLSPYALPRSLWEVYTGRVARDKNDSETTSHGTKYEATAREFYESMCRVTVTEAGLFVHPRHIWLGASPDGLVGSNGLLEIKCPFYKLHSKVPEHYMAQIQGQLEIIDRSWCDFLSWMPGNRYYLVRVHRSRAYWSWMLAKLKAFWVAVQSDTLPAQHRAAPKPPPVRVVAHPNSFFG